MTEKCINFLNTLAVANKTICSIRIYLHGNIVLVALYCDSIMLRVGFSYMRAMHRLPMTNSRTGTTHSACSDSFVFHQLKDSGSTTTFLTNI